MILLFLFTLAFHSLSVQFSVFLLVFDIHLLQFFALHLHYTLLAIYIKHHGPML